MTNEWTLGNTSVAATGHCMGMCSLRKRSAKGRSRESDEDGGDDPREDEEDGSETMLGGAVLLRPHAPSKLSKSR